MNGPPHILRHYAYVVSMYIGRSHAQHGDQPKIQIWSVRALHSMQISICYSQWFSLHMWSKETVITLNPIEEIHTFFGTCHALVVDRTGPVFSHTHCPSVLYTLCKFQPAIRNGLCCTPRQRTCRDPGHRQTHLTQIV